MTTIAQTANKPARAGSLFLFSSSSSSSVFTRRFEDEEDRSMGFPSGRSIFSHA